MSEEREAVRQWRNDFFDRTSREPTPTEAWYAALKWQASRQSAGETSCPHGVYDGACKQCYAEETEREQRRKMQERFAQRPQTPATADFDLPAPNDAICESCDSEGIIGSHACPDCSQPAESKRVELTDDEIDAIYDSVPWKDLNVASLEHATILRRRFARALLARAQAKGE